MSPPSRDDQPAAQDVRPAGVPQTLQLPAADTGRSQGDLTDGNGSPVDGHRRSTELLRMHRHLVEKLETISEFSASRYDELLTTREAEWYIISVMSVCMCVCLSDDNFLDRLDVGRSLSFIRYISRGYGQVRI